MPDHAQTGDGLDQEDISPSPPSLTQLFDEPQIHNQHQHQHQHQHKHQHQQRPASASASAVDAHKHEHEHEHEPDQRRSAGPPRTLSLLRIDSVGSSASINSSVAECRAPKRSRRSESPVSEMQGCGSDGSSDDAHEFQQQRSAVAMESPASDACGFFPAVVPPAPAPAPAAADGDESSTCSICLDGWGISGAHRVVSLKCGHLFGLSCVRKWLLRGNGRQKTQKGRCPECNQPAATRDIRAIFARSIRALDDSRQQELQREIKRLASRTCELESELQHYQVLYAQMRNEAMRARTVAEDTYRRLQWLEAESAARNQTAQGIAGESTAEPTAEPLPVVLRLRATVPLATAPGESARILALDPHEPLVYASFSRPGRLHTMAVVSAHDAHTASGSARTLLPPLHSEEIRGAEVSPHTSGTRYLLTASMDQT
ncbi:RING finger and WD repeat domain-containing protein 3, partial [Kickxella alabastrina]